MNKYQNILVVSQVLTSQMENALPPEATCKECDGFGIIYSSEHPEGESCPVCAGNKTVAVVVDHFSSKVDTLAEVQAARNLKLFDAFIIDDGDLQLQKEFLDYCKENGKPMFITRILRMREKQGEQIVETEIFGGWYLLTEIRLNVQQWAFEGALNPIQETIKEPLKMATVQLSKNSKKL